MNSDLVYKKKYLKYKSKYTALQREMNVQEGGFGWGDVKVGAKNLKSGINLKYGWYLYLTNEDAYNNLFADLELGLLHDDIISNKDRKICTQLIEKNTNTQYVERSINVFSNTSNIISCATPDTKIVIKPQFFSKSHYNVNNIRQYLSEVSSNNPNAINPSNTHWFIVDYNATGNRISKLQPRQ
jgi:hypothetical protein